MTALGGAGLLYKRKERFDDEEMAGGHARGRAIAVKPDGFRGGGWARQDMRGRGRGVAFGIFYGVPDSGHSKLRVRMGG